MAHELRVIDNPSDFSEAVGEVKSGAKNELILGKWSGGLLEFAGVAFPGVEPDDIFVKRHEREATGRGAHFDAYKEFVDPQLPWAGHYNLSGEATIETVVLPDDLAKVYETRYPVQDEKSAQARRHLSRFALEAPDADVGTGRLLARSRFVLPVRPEGPYIVHDIVPVDSEKPGSFVKLIVPPRTKDERDDLASIDYVALDAFLTNSIGAEPEQEEKQQVLSPPQQAALRLPRPTLPSSGRYRSGSRCQGID